MPGNWAGRTAPCARRPIRRHFSLRRAAPPGKQKVCRSCEVRAECLEYALENDERFGIWGGLSERERRRLKREAV